MEPKPSSQSNDDNTAASEAAQSTSWAQEPVGRVEVTESLDERPDSPHVVRSARPSAVATPPVVQPATMTPDTDNEPISRPDTFADDTVPAPTTVESDATKMQQDTAPVSPQQPAASSLESTAAVAPAAAPAMFTKKKRLTGRVWALIALGAVLLILGAAIAGFFLVYNKPENAVADSFMKFMTAKTSSTDATFSFDAGSQGGTNLKIHSDNAGEQGTLTIDGTVKSGDKTLPIRALFVGDNSNTLYFKFEKIEELVAQLKESASVSDEQAKAIDSFVEGIDSKWVSASEKDLETLTGQKQDNSESECVQKQLTVFRDTPSQQKEIRDVYDKNQFIAVEPLGTETVNGIYSNHYKLKSDEVKVKSFMRGIKDTQMFKNVDNCVKTDLAKSIDDAASDNTSSADSQSSKTTTTIEYWVSVFDHSPVKLAINTTDGEAKMSFVATPKLNNSPKVTIPKADKSIVDIKAELEDLMTSVGDSVQANAATNTIETQAKSTRLQIESYYADNDMYLAPSDITTAGLRAKLPGLSVAEGTSVIAAIGAGPQSPTDTQIIYQGLTTSGALCTTATTCQKFVIWYQDPATKTVKQLPSLN